MVYAAHFAAAALVGYLTASVLRRSRWTWHSPRTAIVCWQAVGLALGLCVIGLPTAIGLAAYDEPTGSALRQLAGDIVQGDLPAGIGPAHLGLVALGLVVAFVLLSSTVRSLLSILRARRRHRDLLALVARDDPAVPGVLVLDHPSAAAYCLPGARPRVVVSTGALSLLDRAQLAAVLSHERAHADERHDLVLLPFTGLCRLLPWARWIRAAHDAVALLIEMRADDKARRQHAEAPLAGALLRFAEAPLRVAPVGTLGIADQHLDARVKRLLDTGRPPRGPVALALFVAAYLSALPICLFLA